MKKIIPFVLLISVLISCRNEKKDSDEKTNTTAVADTLTYVYDSVKVYSKNIINTQQIVDTAKAVITYPVFKDTTLNTLIQRKVTDFYGKEEKLITYPEMAKSFINGYDAFFAENKDTPQHWFLLIDIEVLRQTENYIALRYQHSDYVGGAHGNSHISYINYNPKTNTEITLDSLIDTTNRPKLLSIAEGIFRKNEKLTPTETLAGKYFFLDDKFSLPESYYVSDKGLVFMYNPYEIKAYAFGTTELVIPFAAVKEIAKPNTILSSQK
ncbi:MAG: DUF3298 domain-containing protein [Pedobacter sp.]|nr:MAG: DUF3298 domain-containing protein [Pedobacter sp.]